MIEFPVPGENIRQNGRQYARQRAEWAHFRNELDWFVARTMMRACQWLEDNAEKGKFFLWVDTFEIHMAEENSELVEKFRAGLVKFMWQQGADEEYIEAYAEGS